MFVDIDIMLSLRGRWWKEIIHDNKVYEVRKNRPNIDVPFKVYAYVTKSKDKRDLCYYSKELPEHSLIEISGEPTVVSNRAVPSNGMVVGEFVVDKIIPIKYIESDLAYYIEQEDETRGMAKS